MTFIVKQMEMCESTMVSQQVFFYVL